MNPDDYITAQVYQFNFALECNNYELANEIASNLHDKGFFGTARELFNQVSEAELEKKLELNERAMKFVPLGTPAYRRAMLLALADRQSEARVQIERAIWSFPGDFAAQSRELSALAQKDPAHFSALLEFAIQKNEEYSSAVSTR